MIAGPRSYFIFDPQVVNEQKCIDDGLLLRARGEVTIITIHKHKDGDPCWLRDRKLWKPGQPECYILDEEY